MSIRPFIKKTSVPAKDSTKVITLRLNPDTYELIKRAAERRSMTISAYIKMCISNDNRSL